MKKATLILSAGLLVLGTVSCKVMSGTNADSLQLIPPPPAADEPSGDPDPNPTPSASPSPSPSPGGCPDYSTWDGGVSGGDILVLQEGGPNDSGGDIRAFDSDGCYKGIAKAEGSPWYAWGLKVGNAPYGAAKVLIGTYVDDGGGGAATRGVYEYSGPTAASPSVVLGTPVIPPGASGLGVPTGFEIGFTNLYQGQNRYVATNDATPMIKSYLGNSEEVSCRIDTTGKLISDIYSGLTNWGSNYVYYAWKNASDQYGVDRFTHCSAGATLTPTNLFTATDFMLSGVRIASVMDVKKPGSSWNRDVFIVRGAPLGGTMVAARYHDTVGDGTGYEVQTNPFVGTPRAITQFHYRQGSSPTFGSIYTVETDAGGTHIRKYSVASGTEGTLEATLYTETTPTVFTVDFSYATWIAVLPPGE